MNFLALATDYDGTIAHDGQVDEATVAAMRKLGESGRKLILVTGRELKDLFEAFPHCDVFDRIVAENGAVLHCPKNKTTRLLTEPAPQEMVARLRERGVTPLSAGDCVVATWQPQECTVLEAIRDLGIERQITFNKGAVMVLPSGVNKASGLLAALQELELSAHNVVAVGDAQNDLSFLEACECSAAVANALESVRQRADMVMTADHGAGVAELIAELLDGDLEHRLPELKRGSVLLGTEKGDSAQGSAKEVRLPALGTSVLVAGTSGAGKSTVVTGLLERLARQSYQFCLFDPEGDYEQFAGGISLGGPHHVPETGAIFSLLTKMQNPIVNLLGVPLENRPAFMAELLPRVQELRAKTGRPHWVIVDEMHHMLPVAWSPASTMVPQMLKGLLGITVHPGQVAPAVLRCVDVVLAVGDRPEQTIREFCDAAKIPAPEMQPVTLERLEVLAWFRRGSDAPKVVCAAPGATERTRHRRKYTAGDLHEKSFCFRGPEGKLKLQAQNLTIFLQMADGVDEATWTHHLRAHDYSHWIDDAIKDHDLAARVRSIEDADGPADASRREIAEAIRTKYTAAE